jgi:hypothetical protein
MPRLDAIHRPAEAFVVIPATPEMNAEAAALLSRVAYARFERPPARDALQIMGRAIASTFGALNDDITITEHFPEPFLIRFKYPHHREATVSRHDFIFDDYKIHVRPWRLEDNAEQVTMRQHVRLCVENVPLYAWNASTAQQAIGSACSLDYIEDACLQKTYTKALCVWAWVANPGLVPRVSWVTLPGPASVPGVRERGRRGLQRRCIVHLDIVEDMTVEDAPLPGRLTWRWGVVDNERTMRDRAERVNDDADRRDRGRRDDDDGRGDRDNRRCGSSRNWREKLRQSLSRPAVATTAVPGMTKKGSVTAPMAVAMLRRLSRCCSLQ